MNSRRKFLRNGSLAASVLFATKPFKTIAGTVSPFSGGSTGNRVTLLHTGNSSDGHFSATASSALSAKKASGNALLVNAPAAGNTVIKSGSATPGIYDAALAGTQGHMGGDIPFVLSNNTISGAESARILYKGDIKIGVLGIAQPASKSSFGEINRLAKILKEERNCNLVVCISSLGYQNSSHTDDVNLAKSSKHLDVIISGNNAGKIPSTVLTNSEGAEVLLDHAGNSKSGIGKIEIGFNKRGEKNYISFGAATA